jgi:predicted ATP-grasp superfamily ATP-dependent carboligase
MSAVRAQIPAYGMDLFADVDLQAICPCTKIPVERYPHRLAETAVMLAPPGPWMYTGGLENHPDVVDKLSRVRVLWGNPGDTLRTVRNPFWVSDLMRSAGLSMPETRPFHVGAPVDGSWLVKPLASAGGAAIRVWRGGRLPTRAGKGAFFQKRSDGEPHSAVFFADGRDAILIGITRMLVGEPWLHAAPFAYCGSYGPIELPQHTTKRVGELGGVLVNTAQLRGFFGVDFLLQNGEPWLVEVNPRYTASIEVLELGMEWNVFALLRGHFDDGLSVAELSRQHCGQMVDLSQPRPGSPRRVVAKAILFAKAEGTVWKGAFRGLEVQDVPELGAPLKQGQPIVTLMGIADKPEVVLEGLRGVAAKLDHRLFGA